MKETASTSDRAAWGDGRVAYTAHSREIEELLAQNWPLAKIYRKLEDRLTSLSYAQFVYHVRRNQRGASKKEALKNNTDSTISKPPGGENEADKTNIRTTSPGKYRPAPRIPDPSKLY